jgi:4-hydroxyphenylpyruvate dioxygenase
MWEAFAFEEGGCLPIVEITRAIIQGLGYKGWVSLELFSRSMAVPGEDVPEEHARRGRESWDELKRVFQLDA